ncbi:FHA domain-containing protein [Streptomyces sp. NBC_00828]|uniref:FHA domain-containing protein n=1 Tax=Streptomyces sp. NBC_00828 TaxID=2903678 RepID=UPI00386FFC7B
MTGGDTAGDPPPRYVDKGLADEGLLDADWDERDDEGEESEEGRGERDPPPWTEPEPEPQSEAGSPAPSHACWSCGSAVPSGAPACPECQESTGHLRLVSARPPLNLRHGAGAPLRLGRHPVWAAPAVAAAVADDQGLSRRHATVAMAQDGTVWLRENPEGTVNGTYVNDERLPQGSRVPLADGDVVRLGRNLSFVVLLVEPSA